MEFQKNVIALGFFDGVHAGHRAILQTARQIAAENNMKPAALTFETHPRSYVLGISPPMITTAEERVALLSEQGMSHVIVLPFDEQLATTTPEDFVLRILLEQYNCGGIVSGSNFRFGKNAAGNPDLLEKLGKEYGILVNICSSVQEDGKTVSSTMIRKLIAAGQMEHVRALLCRPFSLWGSVVSGTQTGRKIGVPTINMRIPDGVILPARGVYASSVLINGKHYPSVTNVGSRPTFTDADITTVETHILNYNDNAYGSAARVFFLKYLREEITYSSADALKSQIALDISRAIEINEGETAL